MINPSEFGFRISDFGFRNVRSDQSASRKPQSAIIALCTLLLSLEVVASASSGRHPVRISRPIGSGSAARPLAARSHQEQPQAEPGKPDPAPSDQAKPDVGKPEEGVPSDDRKPRLVIRKWAISRALIQARQEVTIQLTIANSGGGVIRNVKLEGIPSRGLEVLESEVPEVGFLGPDEEMVGSWTVRADQPDLYRLRVVASDRNRELQRLEIPVAVTRM